MIASIYLTKESYALAKATGIIPSGLFSNEHGDYGWKQIEFLKEGDFTYFEEKREIPSNAYFHDDTCEVSWNID